jgi:cyclic pyranopterin monophosphate synthase
MKKLDHIDEEGKIHMIDVTLKPESVKEAQATGFIHLKADTVKLIKENELQKGEVLTVAEIAGVQAAKTTWQVVPLVHEIPLTLVEVKAYVYPNGIEVKSTVKAVSPLGVETEALTAACAALLTIYEICKGTDTSLVISDIKLLHKTAEKNDGGI